MTIQCHFDQISANHIAGWAWDPADSEIAIVVDLFEGDVRLGRVEASKYREDLERAKYRSGRCAFEYRCAPGQVIGNPEAVLGVFRHPLEPQRVVELKGRRFEDGWVDFGSSPAAVLKPLGLSLSTLRGRQRFGEKTRFEVPIVVDAAFAPNATYEIGAFTGIYGGTLNRCTIGRYCSIAADVVVGPNEHPIKWLTTSLVAEQPHVHGWNAFIDPNRATELSRNGLRFEGNDRRTVIGNDVWIGNGVFVRAGVKIGDGAVIGARSVVVSDVPAYAIAVGNPARVKRMRFPDPTIERLQRIKWWRFCLYELSGTRFDHLDEAMDTIEQRIALGTLQEYRPEPFTLQRLRDALAGPTRPAAQ